MMLRVLLMLLALGWAAGAEAKPRRVVSLNLCTDQLVMQLADRGSIAAVTYLAADPASSAMARQARGLRTTRGTAEDVIALKPDLILAGPYSTRETVGLLRRLGHEVIEFAPAGSLSDIRASVLRMGDVLGEQARARAAVSRFDRRVAQLTRRGGVRPLFADYGPNGFTSGEGTILAELATRAGFRPLGSRLGVQGMRQLPLEQLVLARPALIDLGDRAEAPALANELYRHPALRRLTQGGHAIRIPSSLTSCGTLRTLDALEMLAAARDRLG